MSYTSCSAALLTLVRAYNGGATFTTATSAEDGWTVLDQPNPAAIVAMAGDSEEGDLLDDRGSQGKRQQRHEIGVVIAVPIGVDKDSVALASLHTLSDAVKAHLRIYGRLNNTSGVKRSEIIRTTRDRLIGPTPDRSTHWISTIVLHIWEEFTATYATGDSPG